MSIFWNKVERKGPDECWPWLGFKKPSGHGLTSYKSMPVHASRKAWILTHGEVPHDLCVNHRCDNAACCNPAHMYLGTRIDNMIDRHHDVAPNERRGGRSNALSDEQLAQLWEMRRQGATMRACGEHFGVHFTTIARYITAVRRHKLLGIRLSRGAASHV
jgi:transposase